MSKTTDGPESSHDYRQHQSNRQRHRTVSTIAVDAVDAGHDYISTGDIADVAQIIDDTLIPILDVSRADIRHFADLAIDLSEPFDAEAVRAVLDHGARAYAADGRTRTVTAAFKSLETALIADGYLQGSVETKQRVRGLASQVGERYVKATSNLGGVLRVDDPNNYETGCVLMTGGKGAGKSSSLGTLVEDRIQNGHKIIDVIDYHKAENATYDVENRDPDMDEWREAIGLSTGFADDYDPPDLKVLTPLTKRLEKARVPFRETDGDDEADPVVVPFTIPASELSYSALCMVLPHTTPTQRGYLASAYQKLDATGGDWTLQDVAETVRHETNAGDKVSDRITRSLQTAQSKAFIRDKKCDHRLDWREIMGDEDTIHSFTVHTVSEDIDKKTVLSYLIDKIADVRDELLLEQKRSEYPTTTLVMREIHKVAPNNLSSQDSLKELEKYMIDSLGDIFAMARHQDLEVLADSQRFKSQLADDVAGLFDDIYAFKGQKPDIQEVFNTRIGRGSGAIAEKVSKEDQGICAWVSDSGYVRPIRMAPPRFHHLDAQKDGSGLGFRSRHLDDEELRPAPWEADVPDRLSFALESEEPSDVERFLQTCIQRTGNGNDFIWTETITEIYLLWCDRQEVDPAGRTKEKTHNKVNSKLKEVYDVPGNETNCYPTHPEHDEQKPARDGFTWAVSQLTGKEKDVIPQ